MTFHPTSIPGVILIEPGLYADERGFFLEFYRKEEFRKHGIRKTFVQDNHSSSKKGVLRGLHYQTRPFAQAKLVRVIRGRIWDVVVDLRRRSKTFGMSAGFELTADNRHMLYIPEGLAHGFVALENQSEVIYKTTAPYSPKHERGIFWNDPALGIQWPKLSSGFILNDRDHAHPALKNQTALF